MNWLQARRNRRLMMNANLRRMRSSFRSIASQRDAALTRWMRKGGRYSTGRRMLSRMGRRRIAYASRARPYYARRSQVGRPLGSQTSRTHETSSTGLEIGDTRRLHLKELTQIPLSSDFSGRTREMANVRGFKIWMSIANTNTRPGYFHIAVISPKDPNVTGASLPGIRDAFFKKSTNVQTEVPFSNALTGLELNTLPINTDRFTILKRFRMKLKRGGEPAGGNSTDPGYQPYDGQANKDVEFYVPLNRQLRWSVSDGTESPVDGKVFLVWWFEIIHEDAGTLPVPDSFINQYRCYTYFRNPTPV